MGLSSHLPISAHVAPCWCTRNLFFFSLMHPIGPELPSSAHVACARVCRQSYVLRASHALVQATVGVGTMIIVYIGVAYTRVGGGGYRGQRTDRTRRCRRSPSLCLPFNVHSAREGPAPMAQVTSLDALPCACPGAPPAIPPALLALAPCGTLFLTRCSPPVALAPSGVPPCAPHFPAPGEEGNRAPLRLPGAGCMEGARWRGEGDRGPPSPLWTLPGVRGSCGEPRPRASPGPATG